MFGFLALLFPSLKLKLKLHLREPGQVRGAAAQQITSDSRIIVFFVFGIVCISAARASSSLCVSWEGSEGVAVSAADLQRAQQAPCKSKRRLHPCAFAAPAALISR